ncbi:unnamed protein product [Cylindrotheca closterium]|uniref:RRM domain-containing protein n=1 Tax=Cylindrotheca closterium TaxID=2856 RepID=A0AAD2JNJ7_9STRA|nr:unnamed protein product [Cylindrotheca closterium]
MSTQGEENPKYVKGTRIFLSEVDQTLGEGKLRIELAKVFEVFGELREVFVPTRSTKAYAFIRFNLPEEAQKALGIVTPHPLFKRLKPAKDIAPRNKKHDKQKQKAVSEFEFYFSAISRSNIVCQVHTSHYERLFGFLEKHAEKVGFSVVGGMAKTKSRTISLVFVQAKKRKSFYGWLNSFWFLQNSVHRIFLVDATITPKTPEESIESSIMDTLSTLDQGSVRLQIFPPRLCSSLLKSIDARWDSFEKRNSVKLLPTNTTNTMGVVQLLTPVPFVHNGLYCSGIWESNLTESKSSSRSRIDTVDNDISRAYWKLEEAFDRYDGSLPTTSKVALDCGAAPGGWTQFLERRLECQTIYSIDPGDLHETVLGLKGVKHWRKTIQNSLPELQKQKSRIDIWVSDMCVKDMEQQVDWLLKALEMDVVGSGTFIVLTLKCIHGHSSSTFDFLVEQQLKRLKPLARDLQVIHLFYNRFSERTIMGYLN